MGAPVGAPIGDYLIITPTGAPIGAPTEMYEDKKSSTPGRRGWHPIYASRKSGSKRTAPYC